ncbi:hypothetical protein SESBI_05235 [Sesbania bispinosa]|nr:hypothetical protein SESBI_05235 [Sesbania bispinosa]
MAHELLSMMDQRDANQFTTFMCTSLREKLHIPEEIENRTPNTAQEEEEARHGGKNRSIREIACE